ncbi:hypothetical protein GCM10027398_28410 [Azotobacter salinestris]
MVNRWLDRYSSDPSFSSNPSGENAQRSGEKERRGGENEQAIQETTYEITSEIIPGGVADAPSPALEGELIEAREAQGGELPAVALASRARGFPVAFPSIQRQDSAWQ